MFFTLEGFQIDHDYTIAFDMSELHILFETRGVSYDFCEIFDEINHSDKPILYCEDTVCVYAFIRKRSPWYVVSGPSHRGSNMPYEIIGYESLEDVTDSFPNARAIVAAAEMNMNTFDGIELGGSRTTNILFKGSMNKSD